MPLAVVLWCVESFLAPIHRQCLSLFRTGGSTFICQSERSQPLRPYGIVWLGYSLSLSRPRNWCFCRHVQCKKLLRYWGSVMEGGLLKPFFNVLKRIHTHTHARRSETLVLRTCDAMSGFLKTATFFTAIETQQRMWGCFVSQTMKPPGFRCAGFGRSGEPRRQRKTALTMNWVSWCVFQACVPASVKAVGLVLVNRVDIFGKTKPVQGPGN